MTASGIWSLTSVCQPGFASRPGPQRHRGVENTAQNPLFSPKMPSTVSGTEGKLLIPHMQWVIRLAGKLLPGYSLLCFAAAFQKALIPLFWPCQHSTGAVPFLLLLYAGLNGSFASALSASFFHTLVWLCLLRDQKGP